MAVRLLCGIALYVVDGWAGCLIIMMVVFDGWADGPAVSSGLEWLSVVGGVSFEYIASLVVWLYLCLHVINYY